MDQAFKDNESEVKVGMKEPLIQAVKINLDVDDKFPGKNDKKGSIGVALLSTFVAVMGSFEFGSCVGYSAPVQSSIREDIGLSLAEFSFFGSILTVGSMIGAITSGNIADFIGRKRTMGISAVICITGWTAIYFAQEALLLDAGRFLTGYGVGVFSYVVPIYIAEIAPKELRGGLATMNQLMIVIGASTTFLLGTVVDWQMLTLTGTIPCIVQLAGLVFIPESPRWLAKAGYHKEVDDALRTLRGNDVDIAYEAAEIQDSLAALQNQPKAAFLDLFKEDTYIHSLLV